MSLIPCKHKEFCSECSRSQNTEANNHLVKIFNEYCKRSLGEL